MRPEDKVRIRHIVDAAREAITFAQGQTKDSLEADHMVIQTKLEYNEAGV